MSNQPTSPNPGSSAPTSPAPQPAETPTRAPTAKRVRDVKPGDRLPCPGHIVTRVIHEDKATTIVTDQGEKRHPLEGDPAIEVL